MKNPSVRCLESLVAELRASLWMDPDDEVVAHALAGALEDLGAARARLLARKPRVVRVEGGEIVETEEVAA